MRRNFFAAVFSIALVATPVIRGQAPNAKDEKLLALLKEVQAQQAQIADNQAKIDAKLAAISETIRMARIFTSREK